MAENYNILPTRGPVINSMQLGTEQMLTTAGKMADREWEKKKEKAREGNTLDKILKYAGTALDMYSKWEDIEGKKLDHENKQLDQQVKTLQLETARIQAQTQTAQFEKDTKYSKELAAAMESGDPNKVYSVMMSNLEATRNNQELTNSAIEYCVNKGMQREDFNIFNPTEAALMRKIQAQTQGRLELEAAKAQAKYETPEMKANKEATMKMERSVLSLGNSLASDPKLVAAFTPIVENIGAPDGVESLKQDVLNGFVTCETIPNWEEEFGNSLNNPDYEGPLSGNNELLSQYATPSTKQADLDRFTPMSEDSGELTEGPMSVQVPDKKRLENIYICTNKKTGKSAIIPMSKSDSENFNNLLGEGARREADRRKIMNDLGIKFPTEDTAPTINTEQTNGSRIPVTEGWATDAIVAAKGKYGENPQGAVADVVAAMRANVSQEKLNSLAQELSGKSDVKNTNEVLTAFWDAYLSGKSDKEMIAAARAVANGKAVKSTGNLSAKSVQNTSDKTEGKTNKTNETPQLLKIKEKYNAAKDDKEKDLATREYTKEFAGRYIDTNLDSAMPTRFSQLLSKAGVDPTKFDDVKNNKDIIKMIVQKRLDGVGDDEIATYIKNVVPEEYYKKERPIKVTDTSSFIKKQQKDYEKADDNTKENIKGDIRKKVAGNYEKYRKYHNATATLKKYLGKAGISQTNIDDITNISEVIDIITEGLASNASDDKIVAEVKATYKLK